MEEKKNDIMIVGELPQVPANKYLGEDGTEYNLITINEALKEIYKDIKELKKGLLGESK